MVSEFDLEEMERLSASYVPDQKGPLLSPLLSSQALTAEYAKADPVFASKTKTLPEQYPYYRTVRGDGNCGWRAMSYGYVEAVMRCGDPVKIKVLIERLKSLNNLLDATGQEAYLYEDFVAVLPDLLEEMITKFPTLNNEETLLSRFNDLETANAITQHFRMITSAFMRLNPNDFAPFIPDVDLQTYCSNNIDPFYVEIDNIGVKALIDAIINPAGISVECLYLDRSVGDEANLHSFQVHDSHGRPVETAPTIRLLYRPGHYDLLYKQGDVAPHSVGNPVQQELSSQPEVRAVFSVPEPFFIHQDTLVHNDLPAATTAPNPTAYHLQTYQTPTHSYQPSQSEAFSLSTSLHQPFFPSSETVDQPTAYQPTYVLRTVPDPPNRVVTLPPGIKTEDELTKEFPNTRKSRSNARKLNWSPWQTEQAAYDYQRSSLPTLSSSLSEGSASDSSDAQSPSHFRQKKEVFTPQRYNGRKRCMID